MSTSINVSSLFSNFGYSTSSSSSTSSLSSSLYSSLSDYALIKSGSYAKLMKAYYATVDGESSTSSSSYSSVTDIVKDSSSTSNAAALYKSLANLQYLDYSDDSDENMDTIYQKVSSFIDSYNNLMKSATNSENAKVVNQASAMFDTVVTNYNLLSAVGITIDEDGILSIDEDTFKGSNSTTGSDLTNTKLTAIQNLFSGVGSFADKLGDAATSIYQYASGNALNTSTYNSQAMYSAMYNAAATDSLVDETV